MHQALQGATFHVEHIIPRSRDGTSALDNLALACPGYNLHKSDNVEALDPESTTSVPLFHPRRDPWDDHFQGDKYRLVGLTAIGRATIAALDLNHTRRLRIRESEALFDLFPP
jgi:hypothetical protein